MTTVPSKDSQSHKMSSASQVALITGASTGIGAATAREFAEEGLRVAVHYNSNRAAAEGVVAHIRERGGCAWLFQADLTVAGQARRLVADVHSALGQIDILVNNAGSLLGRKTLLEIDENYWQQVIDLNLSGVLWVTQAAARHMIEQRSGAIVNVGSIAARNGGGPGVLAYAAAKAGLIGMTKALARELIEHGIRVNAVNPGVILTPLHERFTSPERMAQLVDSIPQGRAGTPEEVASVVTFLACRAASHIVGETIEINGGIVMD